ncbi:hypothetical protein Gorai_024213, partial [Gossypium raimondii]|nr:hypothetical protein [Gossypium raimondii]
MGIEDDATKVNIVAIYFTNVTLLWWCRKSTDEKRGEITIGTWEEFQTGFKSLSSPNSNPRALLAETKTSQPRMIMDDKPDKATMKLGVILSSVETKKGRKRKWLMFVDIIVEGKRLNASLTWVLDHWYTPWCSKKLSSTITSWDLCARNES